ncbi:hypothetical protein G5B42_07715, partial [Hydrogenispora sp. UU3]|nr:hypothetical protein [Capillibacterium thermochitinicola]
SYTTTNTSRAEKAKALENGLLKVELAEKTLEYDLFKENKDILLEIFKEMHPKAAERIKEGTTINEHASNFLKRVEINKAKSELSHRLAIRLESDVNVRNDFKVPEYIQRAIRWVVKGEQ